MDRVRFGRALGYGARHAAKSLVQAVDAATTAGAAPPGTSRPQPASPSGKGLKGTVEKADSLPHSPAATLPGRDASFNAAAAAASMPQASRKASTGSARSRSGQARHLGRSLWSPLAHFSGVVWYQVTGTFFTVIALFLSQGLWKQRQALHLPLLSTPAERLYMHAAAFAIFAYFAISSFVRAHLRQRR